MSGTEIESRKQEEDWIRKENVLLEERTRITQGLHDTFLQSFLGASMQISTALQGVSADSLVKQRLERILQLMEEEIEQGGKTLQHLRSPGSGPSDLAVALSGVQQELAVQPNRVHDNGCGIDPQVLREGREGHWGLAGMRERAARIGGQLKISSNANHGTEVLLSIPRSVAFRLRTGEQRPLAEESRD